MQVALLTDIHFGARNDSLSMHLFFQKFYEQCFFPYLDKNGIKTVILGGDTFDKRRQINFLSLHLCNEYFFKEVDKRGIRLIVNIGNHDVFYKNTNSVNSPELLLANRGYEFVVDIPVELQLGGTSLLMVPWITSDNYNIVMQKLQETTAEVMYGHLELAGFEMTKGIVIDSGMSADIFDKFDMVLTGHYHHKSNRKNIYYLGSPYEMTWGDYDDPHGFHIFETDTRELTFVENPFRIFHKLYYDDTNASDFSDTIVDFSPEKLQGCYIKLIVSSKKKPILLEKVIDVLEKSGVEDLQVVEDHLKIENDNSDIESGVEETVTILKKYVRDLDGINVDRQQLESLIVDLYNQAIWSTTE